MVLPVAFKAGAIWEVSCAMTILKTYQRQLKHNFLEFTICLRFTGSFTSIKCVQYRRRIHTSDLWHFVDMCCNSCLFEIMVFLSLFLLQDFSPPIS